MIHFHTGLTPHMDRNPILGSGKGQVTNYVEGGGVLQNGRGTGHATHFGTLGTGH